ncbi:MAG: hypothetical protein PHC89_00545 [Candidatus Pacebacteria bacterium]|nr:hypothetical protein [Candidatus Paceibacterota bacterium]
MRFLKKILKKAKNSLEILPSPKCFEEKPDNFLFRALGILKEGEYYSLLQKWEIEKMLKEETISIKPIETVLSEMYAVIEDEEFSDDRTIVWFAKVKMYWLLPSETVWIICRRDRSNQKRWEIRSYFLLKGDEFRNCKFAQ